MRIIFCASPLNARAVDADYEAEADAASRAGMSFDLIGFEALVNEGDAARAVRRVPEASTPGTASYRGWMLTPDQYARLYDALLERGVRLINDPAAYRHCHYLPESYSIIEGRTPRSVWTRLDGEVDIDRIMRLLAPFGSASVIVKDFVKSRKHEWAEACFIPSASDRATVERVVRRLVEQEGDDLNEGLVFREFVEFEPLTTHSRSGMPLTREYRLFFFDGEPVSVVPYWEEGDYAEITPPIEPFLDIARSVRSHFFTMDVARRRDGEWMIVELGDGQVAGLPESIDVPAFYSSLRARWPADVKGSDLSSIVTAPEG